MSVDKIVSVNNCIYLCHVLFICSYVLQQMEVIKNIHTSVRSLSAYNRWRKHCNLGTADTFEGLTDIKEEVRSIFSELYE